MAIEIKELFLQLHLGESKTEEQKDGKSVASNDEGTACNNCGNEPQQEEMVNKTVNEVLRILKEQKER